MGNSQDSRVPGSKTSSPDVLFVTNQEVMPAQIAKLLANNNLSWAKVGVQGLGDCVEKLGVIGTVMVDTVEIDKSGAEELASVLRGLQRVGTATILLNNYISLCQGMGLTVSTRQNQVEFFCLFHMFQGPYQ